MEKITNFNIENLKSILPDIPADVHKTEKGGVFICGGSTNYRGAPLLAAFSALKSGAGYVVLAIPDFMIDSATVFLPEAIFAPIATRNGNMIVNSLNSAIDTFRNKCSAAVFGPGIGREDSAGKLTNAFISKWDSKMIIDADALYFIAKNGIKMSNNAIITPHSGEAATLLHTTAEEINKDRVSAVKKLAEISTVALLKGKGTLVCDSSEIRKVDDGSAALAVPGSGDVLCGIIAAFAAKTDIFHAATAGALAHAIAGRVLEEKIGLRGVLARDIANIIPHVLHY